jgi:hypothetical protein
MGQDINIKNEQLFQDEANSGKVTESDLCPKARTLIKTAEHLGLKSGGSQRRFCPSRVTHSQLKIAE